MTLVQIEGSALALVLILYKSILHPYSHTVIQGNQYL